MQNVLPDCVGVTSTSSLRLPLLPPKVLSPLYVALIAVRPCPSELAAVVHVAWPLEMGRGWLPSLQVRLEFVFPLTMVMVPVALMEETVPVNVTLLARLTGFVPDLIVVVAETSDLYVKLSDQEVMESALLVPSLRIVRAQFPL